MTPTQRRKHEWKDEYTLLCERCGYIIEDLDQSLPCPECGKPIIESLPQRRVGTPWQQNPSFRSMAKTWLQTLRHPLKVLDSISFEQTETTRLNQETIAAATLISLIFSTALCFILSLLHLPLSGVYFIASIVPALILAFVLIALSSIEARGIQVIGKTRGFRLTSPIAWAIVGHGSVGWLFAGLSIGFGMATKAVAYNIETISDDYALADNYRMFGNIVMVIGVFTGFLFFETFAYLGLRRCKYANRSRPNPAPNQTPKP